MSLPPLPPHPTPVKAGLERIGVYVSGTRWLLGAVFAIAALWTLPPGKEAPPAPIPVGPQVPLQEWSTAPDLSLIARWIPATLPPPDPRQRKAPCDPAFEVEMEGVCWVPIAVDKCPEDKLVKHNGKCWSRALRVERVPQSGEVRAGNVAGEP